MKSIEHTPLGVAPWCLNEAGFEPARAALHETLFCVGNGRIGVRGSHEEGSCWPGTEQDAIYINGFHDVEDIHYAENGHGLARQNQFMVAVPNAKAVWWRIDEEAFDPRTGVVEGFERTFDFQSGVLTRSFVWVSPSGRRVAVTSHRMASFERTAICALRYEIRVLDGAARITLSSAIDARAHETEISDDPRVGSVNAAKALVEVAAERMLGQVVLLHRTKHSGLSVATAMHNHVRTEQHGLASGEDAGAAACLGHSFTVDVVQGECLQLDKVFGYETSQHAPQDALMALASRAVDEAALAGFDLLCAEQRAYLWRFWQDADVQIEGHDTPGAAPAGGDVGAIQQGLRFNLLQLLQSVGTDGRTNIAAKGVTGSGYDGHYFWDTEIYVFPLMLHTQPRTARKLLEFRFHTLPAARARAHEMSHARGALFPWRTIAGPECSAYYPAGTAQFHINADIAFAVKRYWEATGDDEFMLTAGAELVLETARVWMDLGHFEPGFFEDGRLRRFCIHTVTGPDEYTALVNNNLYTNAMAQMHLGFAADVVAWLMRQHAEVFQRLRSEIALEDTEAEHWREAAACMYLPYDRERGVHPQDDSFLSKPRWRDTDASKRPLLLHYHSLVIYRHQICKQADVLLALLLLGERFDADDKKRDFDYYEPITTHDSSLSRCIFGIVAAEVGYADKAYRYFVDGVRADLDDHHGNTRHGVHTAGMAGSWLGVVSGFGGLRMQKEVPAFAPTLPAAWASYSFRMRIAGAQLEVAVGRQGCTYRLLEGSELALRHRGESVKLSTARPEATLAL